jgi:DNA-binding transcriptional regulator YiaG
MPRTLQERVDALSKPAVMSDCIAWQGCLDRGGPRIQYKQPGAAKSAPMNVLRALWIDQGRPIPEGHVVFASVCGNPRCVNIDHAGTSMPRERWKRLMSAGWERPAHARAGTALASSLRNSKLTPEQSRECRESSESTAVLAERFGVSRATIQAHRSGRHGSRIMPSSSVFSLWRSL